MNINVIVAKNKDGIIGVDGNLPWHIANDMKFFAMITNGCPLIMGRKTYESIPRKFRPMLNRVTYIITRNKNNFISNKDEIYCNSIDEAINLIDNEHDVFVCGGSEIYNIIGNNADRYYLTTVKKVIEIEKYNLINYFPEINLNNYKRVFYSENNRGIPHTFEVFEKTNLKKL